MRLFEIIYQHLVQDLPAISKEDMSVLQKYFQEDIAIINFLNSLGMESILDVRLLYFVNNNKQ